MKNNPDPERSEGPPANERRGSLAAVAAQDSKRVLLYALVSLAALARLLLQIAALPPYAGLDEVWHVSRLAFVRAEGRNPDIGRQRGDLQQQTRKRSEEHTSEL